MHTLFKRLQKNVHFIFTTHSPFLLSDLPKENINFLKDGKQVDIDINPFGANIHTLLSHGFFMHGGLMGEFAKGKISQIKKFYEEVKEFKDNQEELEAYKCTYDDKKKEFWQIQNIIGEPFLKTIIGNYLDEIEKILFEDKAKDLKISRLQKEIDELSR